MVEGPCFLWRSQGRLTVYIFFNLLKSHQSRKSGNANMKKYLAELIGTFVLVFGGCGSATIAGDHIGLFGIALHSDSRCSRWPMP